MKKIVLSLIFTLSAFLLLTQDVFAFRCSGLMFESFEKRFELADVVFTGKVIELIPKESGYNIAVFIVTHSWKGVASHSIRGISGGIIENPTFQLGEEYLIFGFTTGQDFFGAPCSPASPTSLATDDLFKLQSFPELSLANPPLQGNFVLSFIIALFAILIIPTFFTNKRSSS